MRRSVILAAMLAAWAMAPQPAEAGDRGFGFRHFAPHAGAKFHRPHHGPEFHHRGFFGKQRHFRPPFGQFGHRGLVLKFGDGSFAFKFGHVPHPKLHRFKHRHRHGGLFFGFDRSRPFGPLQHRGFVLKDRGHRPGHLRDLRPRVPRSEGGRGGGAHGGAPPEALLERLEQLGFRHLPELLREQSR